MMAKLRRSLVVVLLVQFQCFIIFSSAEFSSRFSSDKSADCLSTDLVNKNGIDDCRILRQNGSCSDSPCSHGDCVAVLGEDGDQKSHYRCYCRRGYSGLRCEVPVNECQLGFCRNNASCVNQIEPAGVYCRCSQFYTGTVLFGSLTDTFI